MEILKGFCTFNDLILNGQNEVSPIGELSPYSKTFTRNIQQFSADPASFSDLALHVLSYKNSDNAIITNAVKPKIVEIVLPILNWININSRNGEITTDHVAFNNLIGSEFNGSTLSTTATEMVAENLSIGTTIVPKYIEIESTKKALPFKMKIWFLDSYFQKEYDEYEILVIPPVTPVDLLTDEYGVVNEELSKFTRNDFNNAIYETQNGSPCTIIKTTTLTWHQLTDNTVKIPDTEWTTLIYGPRGNNVEVLNDTLIDYILENSSRAEEDWLVIYPDLFIKDEFTIVPLWNNTAIGEHLTLAEVFSPQIRLDWVKGQVTSFFPNYSEEHKDAYFVYTPSLWQSVGYVSCGGNRNETRPKSLDEFCSDLVLAPPGSVDYDRMSPTTRTYLSTVNQLIKIANEYDNDGSYRLPTDVGTIIRSGLIYISATVDNVTYLVLTRKSFNRELR